MGSVVEAHGLSCPTACGVLVPRPGIEPTSPALEGRFLSMDHQGSPLMGFYWRSKFESSCLLSPLNEEILDLVFFWLAWPNFRGDGLPLGRRSPPLGELDKAGRKQEGDNLIKEKRDPFLSQDPCHQEAAGPQAPGRVSGWHAQGFGPCLMFQTHRPFVDWVLRKAQHSQGMLEMFFYLFI